MGVRIPKQAYPNEKMDGGVRFPRTYTVAHVSPSLSLSLSLSLSDASERYGDSRFETWPESYEVEYEVSDRSRRRSVPFLS